MKSIQHIPGAPVVVQLALMLVFMIGAASCSSSRRVIREPLKLEGAEYLFQQLKDHELHFETLSAKFNATYYEDKKQNSFSGQVRIKRDSIIWISISPALGIEMLRIAITNDSVKFIDRIEGVSLTRDFDYISQWMNHALDYDMLQALIIGNDFTFYEQGRFQADIDNRHYKLITRDRQKLKKYIREHEDGIVIPIQNIWLDPDTYKITRVMIREAVDDNRKFEASYDDFEPGGGQLFPRRVNYTIQAAETRIVVDLRYLRMNLDEPLSFPFTVPEKYSRK